MPKHYIPNPITIEAMFLSEDNCHEVLEWMIRERHSGSYLERDRETLAVKALVVMTLEGAMRADLGSWWVIKGVEGEFYPCKDSVFKKKYVEYNEKDIQE